MAYFSNGTEGRDWESRNCEVCAHDTEENPCPVLTVHLAYNYLQCRQSDEGRIVKAILDTLIPTDGLFARPCPMKVTTDIPGQNMMFTERINDPIP